MGMVIIYSIHLYTAVQSLSACWSKVKYKKKWNFMKLLYTIVLGSTALIDYN